MVVMTTEVIDIFVITKSKIPTILDLTKKSLARFGRQGEKQSSVLLCVCRALVYIIVCAWIALLVIVYFQAYRYFFES
jgi:hypothetical protein